MDIYATLDYKLAIRQRMDELNQTSRRITLKEVAEKIPVQYTYLSRVLSGDEKHLSDDQLFTICSLLNFPADETEYLLLLRAFGTSHSPSRRQYLSNRIAHLRETKKLRASMQEFDGSLVAKEMTYLFDPICIVVHVSLGIEAIRQNPDRLCTALGISRVGLREILRKLRNVGVIELDDEGKVTKVNRSHIHYSPKHPLMRAHQNFLRNLSLSHLAKTAEEDKHNFMVTFSADTETMETVREMFQTFIEAVEKKVLRAKSEHTYQLTFDLFKWL